MKTKLLPLFVLFLIIFSCRDVTEISPNIRIEGVYQYTTEGNMGWSNDTFNFVDVMDFKSDGTVTGESYTTELGSDEILGYRGYFSGTYSIMDGKVTISYDEIYSMNIEDINFMPKEELTLSTVRDYSDEYAIAEDYSQLSYVCPPNAFCVASITFIRVD